MEKGSLETGSSANESVFLGLICSTRRNSPRVTLHSIVRRHQRRPPYAVLNERRHQNSLLASEAVPSVSFQRVILPLTVIADPASVSPRTAWICWYSPSGKK